MGFEQQAYSAWRKDPKQSAPSWSAKDEVMLEKPLASWNRPKPAGLLPPLEIEKRPTTGEALGAAWKLWLAESLTKPRYFPGTTRVIRRSWADREQEKAIRGIGKVSKWMFPESRNVVLPPLPENVTGVIDAIVRKYKSVQAFESDHPITIADLDTIVDFRGRQLTDNLYRGRVDGFYRPTPEEQATAVDLELHAGLVPPEEMRELLRRQVLATAVDASLRGSVNHLGDIQQNMDALLLDLESVDKPNVWFMFDPVTRKIYLTKDESQAYGQTLFGFTPSQIQIAKPRARFTADVKPISLHRVSKSGKDRDDIVMEEVTNGPIDTLRRFFGPIIGIDIQTENRRKVPGAVQFMNLNRDASFGVIALRDVADGMDKINELGQTVRGAYDLFDLMTEQLHKQNAPPTLPIRPQVVEGLLKDPSIMRRRVTPRKTRVEMAEEFNRANTDLEKGYVEIRDFWQMQKAKGRIQNGHITSDAHRDRFNQLNQRVRDAALRAQRIKSLLAGLPPIARPGFIPEEEFK